MPRRKPRQPSSTDHAADNCNAASQSSEVPESKSTSSKIRQSYKHGGTAKSKTAWMTKDTGEIVHTIQPTSIELADTKVSSELGFEVLCSYNWRNDGKVILVPGGPPKWTPPPLPVTLPKDSGHQFVDQNAFRVPKYPFEPAFQALSIMNPDARLDGVDIIVNRNSLRKLLDFAAGRRQDPFRMDLHMIQNTLFISRKEKNARLMIHGAANSGYGHNLEKAFTKSENGLDNSSSHHRIIQYQLGRLNCAVRFEVDAYYEATDSMSLENANLTTVDDVAMSMTQLAIDELESTRNKKGATQVIRQGIPISSSKLAEIKAHKTERINAAMPQLWFGRTPYLLTGRHLAGVVHSTSCSHVALQFAQWETTNQDNLRKLVRLLEDLKQIVRNTEGSSAILVCNHKGAPLDIYTPKKKTYVLPKDMVTKYWGLEEDQKN